MILVDTDVLVDCLRGVVEARTWLEGETSEALGIPGVVAMELIVGCRNQTELQRIQKFLGTFDVVWPEPLEFARAYDLLVAHRLTSGLSIPDCLIAAMALARRIRLYTFNAKHFKSVAGLDAQEPYARA
jgi:predicted nucleic acid-binding protein